MFDEIEDIRQTRRRYNFKMFQSGIGTFREFEQMEGAVLRDGALSQKSKELMALAISITQKCLPCIEYHVSAALERGATREEILETVAVALALGGGVAMWPARFAFKVLEELQASGSQARAEENSPSPSRSA
jgi:AhpD family alkylhydroperoxidase